MSNYNELRCSNDRCKQLQLKYKLEGNILKIEIKCYACNAFTYLNINLNQLNNKHESKKQI